MRHLILPFIRGFVRYLDENGEEHVAYTEQVTTSYKDLADGKGWTVEYPETRE